MVQVAYAENQYRRSKIHPQKFALYAGIVSMIMLFAGFTSAYIVRQAAGNWLEYQLPNIFYVSAGVIILSSLTLHFSYKSFLARKETLYKSLLLVTFALGILFVILQYNGWMAMKDELGISLGRNPSGDFLYVISGTHAAHVLGGIAAIFVAIAHAYGLNFKVTPRRKLRLELTMIYWHFVDILWLYLVIFFMIQR